MEKDKRLMEVSLWERLKGKLSCTYFRLLDGAVFPPCYLPGPNYGGGNEDNGDLLQKIPSKGIRRN